MSTKDIADVPIEAIKYTNPEFIDTHIAECGTLSQPLFDCNIKYDTMLHYKVLVIGYVRFGKDNGCKEKHETIDSVGITRVVIDRLYYPREMYGRINDVDWRNKRWRDCPLPKAVLKALKDDFFIRMKYRKYCLNHSLLNSEQLKDGTGVMLLYHLY